MQGRSEALKAVTDREFDLAVIGGGIIGAGIAQNAACRGLSVVLIDRGDFASGTSSRTTKLIHGGLGSLEQLQFRLTCQLSHERALLKELAPHLVKDLSFILPITDEQPLLGLRAEVGLALYDFLAGKPKGNHKGEQTRLKHLSRKDVIGAIPSFSPEKIKGGLRFHECITEDSRLVLEVIKSACRSGAVAINYMAAQSFELEGTKIKRVVCRDRYSGQDLVLSLKSCVNATGVWSDKLMEKLDLSWQKQVAPRKGVHIMLPNSAFQTSNALILPAPGGRYVFVVPWQRALLVGSTDSVYDGPLERPLADEDGIQYLLDVINKYARNDRKIKRSEVIATWAGLRPLFGRELIENRLSKSTISTKHKIFEGPGGIVGLIGGNLTNYRILAEHVVERLIGKLPGEMTASLKPAHTDQIMLGGWSSKEDYLTSTAEILAKARRLSIEPATIEHLCQSYGKEALVVLDIVEGDPWLSKRICQDFPPIMAEVVYAIKHEMAVSLEDVLFRRMRLGLVNQGQCLQSALKVARLAQGILGWDEARTSAELSVLSATLEEHLKPSSPSSENSASKQALAVGPLVAENARSQ